MNEKKFNRQKALEAGYSEHEIDKFLSSQRNAQRSPIEKAARVGTQAALGFAQSAALPYELAVAPLASKEAQHVKLREKLFDEIEELGQRKRIFGLDKQDEDRLQNLIYLTKNPEESEKFVKTFDVGIKGLAEKATGMDLTPDSPVEKFAHFFGGLKGIGGKKNLTSPISYGSSAAAAGVMTGLEEEGANPLAVIGGGIFADILTRSGNNLLKKLGNFAKEGFQKSSGKALAQLSRVKPEQINQEVIDAANRLGIDQLPLSAQVENRFVQGLESKVRASSLSGEKLSKQLEDVSGKLIKQYESIADQLSHRKEMLPGAVSQEAIESLQRIEELGKQRYKNLYATAVKSLPETATVSPKIGNAITKIIDNTLKKLKSDLGSPAKDALYKRLSRLKESWGTSDNIPVQKLIEVKQDLGDIIKYEVKGGVDKLLQPLNGVIRNGIRQYGREENPVFLKNWIQAESEFGSHAREFRKNPMVSSLLEGKQPEQILNKMNTIKGIRDLQNIFGKTPEGINSFDALKRYKLEDLIGSKLLNKKGDISWGNASGMFKKPKTREIVKELVGQKSFNDLKDIERVTSGIEQGLKKFFNSSQTATTSMDAALLVVSPLKAIGYLFAGRPVKAAITAGGIFGPRVLANLMTNPEFIDAVKATSMAGRGSNPELFLNSARRAAAIVTSVLVGDGMNQVSDVNAPQSQDNAVTAQ